MYCNEIISKAFKAGDTPRNVRNVAYTPKMATTILESNNAHGRNTNRKRIKELALDMENGQWVLSHEAISFDCDGQLIDGQQRLMAIVESGSITVIPTWVNMDADARYVTDGGRKRNDVDHINFMDGGDGITMRMVSVAKEMVDYVATKNKSPYRIKKIVDSYRESLEFSVGIIPLSSSTIGIGNSSVTSVIARAFYHVEIDRLKDFCNKLCTGCKIEESEDAIRLLRDKLIRENIGRSAADRRYIIGITERTLYAWLKHEELKMISPVEKQMFRINPVY